MSELNTTLDEILQDKNTNLLSGNLKKGIVCMGIEGSYIGSINGVVSYDNEESLLADISQQINTVGLIQTFVGGDWTFNRLINSNVILLPKEIALTEPFTENKSYSMYYLNDTGNGPGMGPMTTITLLHPSTTDGIHYYIQEGDYMMGGVRSWESTDGIHFVGEDDIITSSTSGWYIGNEYTEITNTDEQLLQDIIHILQYGRPNIRLWNGKRWLYTYIDDYEPPITIDSLEQKENITCDKLGIDASAQWPLTGDWNSYGDVEILDDKIHLTSNSALRYEHELYAASGFCMAWDGKINQGSPNGYVLAVNGFNGLFIAFEDMDETSLRVGGGYNSVVLDSSIFDTLKTERSLILLNYVSQENTIKCYINGSYITDIPADNVSIGPSKATVNAEDDCVRGVDQDVYSLRLWTKSITDEEIEQEYNDFLQRKQTN